MVQQYNTREIVKKQLPLVTSRCKDQSRNIPVSKDNMITDMSQRGLKQKKV